MDVEGTRTFQAPADAYDRFMGRYSRELSKPFADLCLPRHGGRFLDVGCGPGALTTLAAHRLGPSQVSAVDPTPAFVAACRQRLPGVDVRQAPAESLPFEGAEFDSAAAQLVMHFVSDAPAAVREMARVVRPGGLVAASVWDFAEGMEMLRAFWDAALAIDPDAPDEARTMRFGKEGELTALFEAGGLERVQASTVRVESGYSGFDELWSTFLAGIGPAGAYAAGLERSHQDALRERLFERLGRPTSAFRLGAVARVVSGAVPG